MAVLQEVRGSKKDVLSFHQAALALAVRHNELDLVINLSTYEKLFLVAMPGAPSSILAPSSDALCSECSVLAPWTVWNVPFVMNGSSMGAQGCRDFWACLDLLFGVTFFERICPVTGCHLEGPLASRFRFVDHHSSVLGSVHLSLPTSFSFPITVKSLLRH